MSSRKRKAETPPMDPDELFHDKYKLFNKIKKKQTEKAKKKLLKYFKNRPLCKSSGFVYPGCKDSEIT